MPNHRDTTWTEYLFHQVRVIRVPTASGRNSTSKVLRLHDNNELVYAADTARRAERVYLLDKDDQKALGTSQLSMIPPPNLTEFMSHFPRKRIYLRSFTSSVLERDANRRFFAEELLEMVPLLLAQQGGVLDEEVMQCYKKKWSLKYQTIGLEELRTALNDFEIDKSLLTIVPDITNTAMITVDVPLLFGEPLIYVFTPDKIKSVCASQAIFSIFKQVVALLNWNKQCDTVSMGMAKNMILQEMEHILKHRRHCYVPRKEVYRIGDELLEHFRGLIDANSPHHIFARYDFNDLMPVEGFLKLAHELSLAEHYPGAQLDKKQCKTGVIPTWKVHIMLLLDWSRMFFGEEHEELKELVLRGIQHLVPLSRWTGPEDLMTVVLRSDEKKHQESEDMARKSVDIIHNVRVPGYTVKHWKNEYQMKRSRKWVHRDIIQSRIANGESFDSKEIQDSLTVAQNDLKKHWEKEKEAYLESTELGMQLLRKIVEQRDVVSKEPSKKVEKSSSCKPIEHPHCTKYACELERSSMRARLTEIERDLKLTHDGIEHEWRKKVEEKEKTLRKKMEAEQRAKKSVEKMRKQLEELKVDNKKLQEQLEKSRKQLAPSKGKTMAKKSPIKLKPTQKSPAKPLQEKKDAPSSWCSSTRSTAPTGELEDNECVICLEELETKENEHKCSHCKRRYHAECSSAWLNKNSTCPICKRLMIDPKEFPAL